MQKETTKKSPVAEREEAILQFWQEHDFFKQSVEKPASTDPEGDFIFYDGPPFATGLPHYGHILASTIKDAVPRFWTMNGYRVRRKWGWDCHGLPLENLIEKKLGLANKRDIEEYGIKNFNEAARGAVLEYADDWRQIIPRMGRWVDMDDDYKTMDSSYTESVWWVFKKLHEKGLVFEGFKTMHLCPRCGTTLSNFEVNLGYKDVKDIAVTVKLPLLSDSGQVTDTSLLVWTTTPWTLPGNLAAAVNQDFTYAKVCVQTGDGEEMLILAAERLEQLGDVTYEVLETFPGSQLVGRSYQPPFTYISDLLDADGTLSAPHQAQGDFKNAWKIYHADYVELGDSGTGAVHLAPAYGEDDLVLAQKHGVPVFHHVDYEGKFREFVTDFAGQLVKPKDDDESGVSHLDTDIEIVKALKAGGQLLRKENITHSYPHCWRDDTPLLNYATTSWFVNVSAIRAELVASNKTINWVPEHVGVNRFGKWLEGARDWAVSRQRYWGAPLPIWKNPKTGDYKVFGSLAELKEYVPKSGNKYTLIRHAEAESNLEHTISTDINTSDPLTDKGAKQAEAAVAKLQDAQIDLIVCSPFERTRSTAEIIAAGLGLDTDDIIFDERLQEMQLAPELQGQPWSVCDDLWKDHTTYASKPKGVLESRSDIQRRAGEFIYELDGRYENKNILIVSHKGVLRGLIAAMESMTPEQVTEFDQAHDITNAEPYPREFTPLPHNDHYELDFHRPYIDDLVLEENGVRLERVPDVFDCWFESGSMPYGQRHFMGEAQSDFDPSNDVGLPAQFIAEGLDQTRGWFYSLLVLGVALFGKSPYENVITNGLVLAEDGRKMSKSLQNYPDPVELVERQGADSMRFYLLSSPIIKSEDLNFREEEVAELQRKNIGRLHNVLALYELFADGAKAHADSEQVLDRWILARLQELINASTAGYRAYELDKATRPITDFIDDLSVWYVRRSRDRLKGEDAVDRASALATLRYVLEQLSLVMAPAMPFYAEYLWQQVRAEESPASVHLGRWPSEGVVDQEVLQMMHQTREVVRQALEARVKAGLKVRQPIASVSGPALEQEYTEIVIEELNAKTYQAAEAVSVDTQLTKGLVAEGAVRELTRAVQGMRKEANLQPADRIKLAITADEAGRAAIAAHEAEFCRTAGVDSLTYSEQESGVEVLAGDYKFVVMMES